MQGLSKCMVYPAKVGGECVLKKGIHMAGTGQNGGITIFKFNNPLDLAQFLGIYDELFIYNKTELKEFIKNNL